MENCNFTYHDGDDYDHGDDAKYSVIPLYICGKYLVVDVENTVVEKKYLERLAYKHKQQYHFLQAHWQE